jgi:hypothetical protein
MTELIVQSLARNAVDEAAHEVASLRRYLEVDNHSDPFFRGCVVETTFFRISLENGEVDYHSDSFFRGCIKAVELGQSVKVRIGENPVKYDKIKKRLEKAEQSNSNCGAGQEKDGDMSVPLFASVKYAISTGRLDQTESS